MARFLSAEWFEDVLASTEPPADGADTGSPDEGQVIVEQIVHAGPDGEVRYRVAVAGGRAVIEAPGQAGEVDLTIGCDWSTAVALAQGTLSAQAALLEGRLRVSGDLTRVAGKTTGLAGLDAVPPEVRARTSF